MAALAPRQRFFSSLTRTRRRHAACRATRCFPKGGLPEQKISVAEAVRSYTVGSAYAECADQAKGALAVGKLADLVILSKDIFEISQTEIETARVQLTIVDGRVVHPADRQPGHD